MKQSTHAAIGASVGAVVYARDKRKNGNKITGMGLGLCALLGMFGGILADSLEPATSSKHRGFWHSWVFLLILIGMVALICKIKSIDNAKKVAAESFAGGYISHLAGDFTTQARLPIV
jgi:membrane-bound metal-dependent hydrolase YbcI (DUF457 family)